jgi:hypothetical protein
MATTYLTRSISSTSTPNKLTVSFWLKGGQITSTQQTIFSIYNTGSANLFYSIYFSSNGSMYLYWKDTSEIATLGTTQKFRDTNAWYHFVWEMDTTLATAADRIKMYINGERVTSFEDDLDTITQSKSMDMMENTNGRITIGRGAIGGSDYYFGGSLSHFYFTDGYAYDASTFGSTDATTGEWKINTSPSITMGTNGFTVLKDGNTITDQSSNSNDFTLGAGTLTKTEDCPSNVYCTFNPLIPQGLAYANGNLSATHDASSWKTAYGTIAMSGTGKYYFESKVSTLGSYQGVGIVDAEQISAGASKFGAVSRGYGYKNDGSKTNNNSDASYGATYTTGDIIGCALDLTNGAIYFSKNGAWQNSATTGEIAAGTTTNAAYTSISSSYVYLPAVQIYGSGTNQFNAGNGFFGTTAVSSVQNPSSGDTSAEFEYTPPTGFQPITTKGLNE